MKYFGAIDQGTTSSRFIIFNDKGRIVAREQEEFPQYFPNNVSVEHNPSEIFHSVLNCVKKVDKEFDIAQLESVGITNQRETTIAWSRSTGEPFYNAIVWQDTRTQAICDELKNVTQLKQEFKSTGLPIATYFSLSKILWLIRNVPEVQKGLSNNDVCFGTVDSWLLYKFTGNHVTDVTNASRTLMFNLKTLNWSQKILEVLSIPESSLPLVKPSMYNFGSSESYLKNVPITAVLGDQQASLFGQNCFKEGDIKNTYGTGCFALTNTGHNIVESSNGLLTTIAYQRDEEKPIYALEGSVSIAGAAVQWLRDNLQIINESSEIEELAISVKDNGDVYFVPAFSGLFSPHWDETARGLIIGLTRFTNKNHIARAVLESIAYQSYELLIAMEKDTGLIFNTVKVDGGMISNNLLMQFQADIFDKKVTSQKITEVTSLGVGAASFIFKNKLPLETIQNIIQVNKTWNPNIDSSMRDNYLSKWSKAVTKAKQWI